MNAQLELDLRPLVTPVVPKDATISERFKAFHRANLHVAASLEAIARHWFDYNTKGSMKAFVEQLRWQSGTVTDGVEYKINNDFTALYARLLIDRNPSWATRLQVRERRSA